LAERSAFLVDFLAPIGHLGLVVIPLYRKPADHMDIPEIEQQVRLHLPDKFLVAAIKDVFLARKQAHEHCISEFGPAEYANVAPYYLRGKAEALLRDTAELNAGFTAKVVNSSGWNHTEITSGPVTLTSHAVEGPCAMVDQAQYRQCLAESQASFFSPSEMLPSAKLYALLLHGPYRGRNRNERSHYRYLAGSVYLAFPEFARRRYAHRLDLFDLYPDLVDSLLPREWDGQARLVYRWQARQRLA
jgi:hypothetical protein